MKQFLAGTLCGVLLSGLAGAGLLYRMGKLGTVVDRVRLALTPSAPFEVARPNPNDPNPVQLGVCAVINKPLFPADNAWNRDISKAPVDPNSDRIIATIGADKPLHPEFGTYYQGAPNGIPYVVVGGDQKKVPIHFDGYPAESDQEPYPIPPDAPIEGGPNGTEDRHVVVLDRDNWKLYELFKFRPQPDGKLVASSGAIFDLKSNALRHDGWTSADAAGLPILPGLVRYDECMLKKEIKHALRFTVEKTRQAYVPPATHFASQIQDPDYPPMGMRVRLKADFDISGYPEEARVILKCLQTYGMILADNGGPWFISGAPDPRWINVNLRALKKVVGRNLEVVQDVPETPAVKTEPVKKIEAPPIEVGKPSPNKPGLVELGAGGIINKPLFTQPNNPWNQDISREPVDPMSARIIATIGANKPLHPEFGALYKGKPNGIPYVVVPGDQKKVPVFFDSYPHESDRELYPIPPDVPIEGGPNGTEDRHALILDRDNWRLYELFKLRPQPNGRYVAASGAIFDLKSNALRRDGWTSADAAGLPILPGLVRYDEVMINKEIKHALRFTVEKSRGDYIYPARHAASSIQSADYPPMGMRVRLRADYDISGFPEEARVILKCLQTYGMILADNGGAWFITGAPDERWIDINTHAIKKVLGRDLEVIRMR